MNLRSIDLNLLVVLDALLVEQSVRRAGERVGLSQSATSHALDRLRKIMSDELLVRTATGMEPTARAMALMAPLREALQGISAALDPPHFDPLVAQQVFVIAVETYETITILPRLVDEMRSKAPNCEVTVRSGAVADILSGVDQGAIDVAIGMFENLPDRFMTRRLMSDDHVCVARAGHPLACRPLMLEDYLGAPHLLVSMSGANEGTIDAILAARDLTRRIVMRLPNGLAAVVALSRSDMVATVTRGAAKMFNESAPLVSMELPFPCPPTEFRLIWNKRTQESPAHLWLRQKLAAISGSVKG
jgi:DNA-binding transcriptional LysR family regulator